MTTSSPSCRAFPHSLFDSQRKAVSAFYVGLRDGLIYKQLFGNIAEAKTSDFQTQPTDLVIGIGLEATTALELMIGD